MLDSKSVVTGAPSRVTVRAPKTVRDSLVILGQPRKMKGLLIVHLIPVQLYTHFAQLAISLRCSGTLGSRTWYSVAPVQRVCLPAGRPQAVIALRDLQISLDRAKAKDAEAQGIPWIR